jgi:hypothetical protein
MPNDTIEVLIVKMREAKLRHIRACQENERVYRKGMVTYMEQRRVDQELHDELGDLLIDLVMQNEF